MMSSAERARKRSTLTPETEFSLEQDGFIGALYKPEKDEYPGKAIIMFGGSDGIYDLTKLVAEQYVKRGMTVLALREKGICLRSCYEDAVLHAPEDAQIKVENIGGPVLLLYPEHDAMWPSELSAEKIRSRLKEKNFSHPCKCVSYQFASHMLVPVKSRSTVMFQVERKHPDECWESDMDAFEKTLAFWKEMW